MLFTIINQEIEYKNNICQPQNHIIKEEDVCINIYVKMKKRKTASLKKLI